MTRGYKKFTTKYNKCGRTSYKKKIYYKLHLELRLRKDNNRVDNASSAFINAQKSKTKEIRVFNILITTNQSALLVKYFIDN